MALGFSMHSGEDEQPLTAILGSGINQDGRSSSLTAPNGPSQQQARLNPAVHFVALCWSTCGQPLSKQLLDYTSSALPAESTHFAVLQVMRLALEDAGLHASGISCLEMHGTGTPLGDPIEMGAAAAVFGEPTWFAGMPAEPHQALCLGAVKSTLGHTEPAAGATGICRTLFRQADPPANAAHNQRIHRQLWNEPFPWCDDAPSARVCIAGLGMP